jgi:hypothetical protein
MIVTSTACPVWRFVTRTGVLNGKVRWAAVRAAAVNRAPLAVWRPSKAVPD